MDGFKLFFMLLACFITGRSLAGFTNDGINENDKECS